MYFDGRSQYVLVHFENIHLNVTLKSCFHTKLCTKTNLFVFRFDSMLLYFLENVSDQNPTGKSLTKLSVKSKIFSLLRSSHFDACLVSCSL